jgi:hemerythrin-like domain-containing protein
MLVQIGQRKAEPDVVALLVECHGRIRKFLGFAQRIAREPEVEAEEVRAVAGQVRRYFAEALPLHIADEEELIVPALAGAGLDAALAAMRAEHADHAAAVARLVEACDLLARDRAARGELGAAADALVELFEPHLAAEETVIFPAVAALLRERRDAIRQGMRARRE